MIFHSRTLVDYYWREKHSSSKDVPCNCQKNLQLVERVRWLDSQDPKLVLEREEEAGEALLAAVQVLQRLAQLKRASPPQAAAKVQPLQNRALEIKMISARCLEFDFAVNLCATMSTIC